MTLILAFALNLPAQPAAPLPPTTDGTPAREDALYRRLLWQAWETPGPGEAVAGSTLAAHPDIWRARPVRCGGVILGDPAPCRVQVLFESHGHAPADASRACEALVVDSASGDRVVALFLEPGPSPAAHGRIEFTGLFWKVAAWKNRRGEPVSAPYVIARTWTLASPREPENPAFLMLAVPGGIVVASLLIGFLASRRQRAWNDWIPSDN